VYVRRRILAVLVVLLLLALLVPRACQALLGSDEDTGQREEQKAGAPETATGAGSGTKDTGKTETKDAPSDRGVPFVKDEAGGEDTSGEAATDLTAMIVGTAVIGGEEALAAEDAAGKSSSADESAQAPTGPSLAASQQTVVEPQNAPETSRAPARRRLSDAERAPAHRQVLSSTPVTTPARERIRDRGDRGATVPVAVEPVPAAPSVGANDIAFVAGDTPMGTRGVATGFRGNAFEGAVNGGATFNRVGAAGTTPAVLAGGARRTVAGPVRTSRRAIF
jgi:hypothetical protein